MGWERFRQEVQRGLPALGVVAFSGCSIHAVAHLLLARAQHPTPWYWFAAGLVELATAWLVWAIVDTMRKATRSNITKQDRRFYRVVLLMFVVLAIPSLATSVIANQIEFNDPLLGFLFPVLSAACAVGLALPSIAQRYERRKTERNAEEKARKETATNEKGDSTRLSAVALIKTYGAAGKTLALLMGNPMLSRSELAQLGGISPQAISKHFATLERKGAVSRANGTTKVLFDSIERETHDTPK